MPGLSASPVNCRTGRSRSPSGWLMVVTAASLACTAETPPAAPATVADSADITIVENHQAKWTASEAWRVPAEPGLTIGVLDGEAEYQFHEISAAARQSDGDLVVADAGSRTLRIFSPEGVFKKTIGVAGSGPGEFRNPTQVLIQAEDTITVWDDAARRITRFNPDGDLAGVQSVGLPALIDAVSGTANGQLGAVDRYQPILYPGPALLFSDGSLLFRLVEKSLDKSQSAKGGGDTGPSSAGHHRSRSGALRISADLSTVDTVMLFGDAEMALVEAPWGSQSIVPPLAKNTSLALQPNEPRTCIGDQEGPEIRCFNADGTIVVMRWQSDPRSVRGNDPEVEAWRQRTLAGYGQKISLDDVQMLIAQVPIPTERPEYSSLILDRAANLWVKRGPSRQVSGSDDWLVFDRTGILLGPITVPAMRILEIGTDYILGVARDELEVQYLQLFDIVK